MDPRGTTPLLKAAFCRPKAQDLVNLLLQHGAHVDVVNLTARRLLPPDVVVFNHTTLACLAACTVRQYELPYRGILPTTLADFVDRH